MAVELQDRFMITSPYNVYRRLTRIEGFSLLGSSTDEILDEIVEVIGQWSDDWPEGQGFGSSDGTYLVKEVLDNLIELQDVPLKTAFNPALSVVCTL